MAVLSSLALVRGLVSDLIFKRAKEIVSSHKLSNARFEGPSLQISSATCSGSNQTDSYNVSFVISTESPSKPVCQCSCPAASKTKGNLCKHVVALLIVRTEEVAKLSKKRDDALALPESGKAAKGEMKEPSLLDSQATEPFTSSEDAAQENDNEIGTTTASSACQVGENNRKRLLPSWISGGGLQADRKVEMRKGPNKKTKHVHNVDEDEDGDGNGAGNGRSAPSKCRKAQSEHMESLDLTTRDRHTRSRKGNMTIGEMGITDCVEINECLVGQKKVLTKSARGGKGRNGGNASVISRNASTSKGVSKRRKAKRYVESDLSEEEGPEVIDEAILVEPNHDMDLTSEDLVNMAKKHLESELRNGHEPSEVAAEGKVTAETSLNTTKMGSIFSLHGWNDIATKSLEANTGCLIRSISGSQDTKNDEIPMWETQANSGLNGNTLSRCDGSGKILAERTEPADNVVDDMLGLFFGPSLSKAVNAKTECMQDHADTITSSTFCTEQYIPEVILPVSVDAVPQPKKKSSLKDQVMMLLG